MDTPTMMSHIHAIAPRSNTIPLNKPSGGFMKNLSITFLLSFLFFATPVMAGSGHDHGHSHGPISSEEAINKATKKVQKLVETGKIDSTWSKANAAGAKQKEYSNGPEWVVTFKNDKVSDSSKQTLYLFYSLDGNYIAANYTGE